MITPLLSQVDSPYLLSIDLGLRFGWACYHHQGQLLIYGSHHCAQANKLKALSYRLLKALPPGSHLIIEGSGELLKYWTKTALKLGIAYTVISAEQWRANCLSLKEQTDAKRAKQAALDLAQDLIRSQSGRGTPTLRHDTAEACLIGWWGLVQLGWISEQEFKSKLL